MRLVSFDPFRSLGCPGIHYIKPTHVFKERPAIEAADVLLFPDYADISLLYFAMGKKIFPGVSSYFLGFNKIEMTRAFQSCVPANVPLTLILPNTSSSREMVLEEMLFPFVAKLPRSCRGEGVFLVNNQSDWLNYCALTEILYVQEQLMIDRDLRIIWIGDRIVYAYWRIAAEGEFHNNVAHGGSIDVHNIPLAAIELARKVARKLNLDYAGFDIAMVEGHPYLLEFNRLFGLQGLNEANINTGEHIHQYLLKQHNQNRSADPEADLPLL